jgi:two-component system heavy metal sensor histidine kinase CusS
LRTPLTSLLGRTQVMLLHERSAEEYREALESSVEEIERLSRLVVDMLFLAQADSAHAALEREEIDLRHEVETLFEFFAIGCEERGVALRVHGEARACGDRGMLRRALSNLLSNAIRHSPDGARVDVTLERGANEARATVTDQGAGIAPEHLPRVFDRFYRADPSRTRDSGGTGLGLAIVKSIVTMHGGTVSASSDPRKATSFTISLPASPGDRAGALTGGEATAAGAPRAAVTT